MKLTLEINTENHQDILEAVNALKALIPEIASNDSVKVVNDGASIGIVAEDIVNEGGFDFDVPDSIIEDENSSRLKELRDEITELEGKVNLLKSEKSEITAENSELKEKISSLEIQVQGTPEQVEIVEASADVSKYEEVIAELRENVNFHKNRSKENWEELKNIKSTVKSLEYKKGALERQVVTLEDEIKNLKESHQVEEASGLSAELESLKGINAELSVQMKELECEKSKLLESVEFHKGRSKENWDNLKECRNKIGELESENKELKNKIEELESAVGNVNNEDVDRLKSELFQVKSDYEGRIGELKLLNDKLENEVNLLQSKYSEEDVKELGHLRVVKGVICANEKGLAFWNNVENNINKL